MSSKNESINKNETNKQTPNSPFSYLIVPFLGLNALSISQVSWWLKDKTGLTRLTWNTDWAFLKNNRQRIRQKQKKNQLSAIILRAFFLTNPPPSLFIILQYFTWNESVILQTEVIKKKHFSVLADLHRANELQTKSI